VSVDEGDGAGELSDGVGDGLCFGVAVGWVVHAPSVRAKTNRKTDRRRHMTTPKTSIIIGGVR